MSFYQIEKPLHTTPGWSGPQVRVLTAEDETQLSFRINWLLASADFHVLAISVAAMSGSLQEPWTSTVVLQEKVDPLQGWSS